MSRSASTHPVSHPAARGGLAVLLVTLGAGCSGIPDGPDVLVMPGRGRTLTSCQIDDEFCREFAVARLGSDSSDGAVAQFTATAAVVGAALGGLVGGLIDGPRGAVLGGGTGAVGGGAAGYGQSSYGVRQKYQQRYDNAFVQCMYSRGHRVPPNPAWSAPAGLANDRLQIGAPRF